MAHGALRDAQRMASHYAVDLADDLELWKQDHDAAMQCRYLEEKLLVFSAVVRAMIQLVSRRRAAPPPGPPHPGQEDNSDVAAALESVSRTCAMIDDIIHRFEDDSFHVGGASEFRSLQGVVRELLRMSQAGPNPRPVSVDDSGCIFESTGEPFIMPGLEPEAIKEGMADLEAGRVRPLREILSGRQS